MSTTPVKSSFLQSVDYDETTETLIVEFKNGVLYAYDGVSPSDHEALMAADSIGRHFQVNIRDQFPCARVPLPAEQHEHVAR